MQQQWPQDENIACARRAWHVPIERHVRDLSARYHAIYVAPRNDAEGSGFTVGGVEVNTKRD
jgi:hypothetical protein